MTQIVIPGADEFGARVNHRTPLAKVIAVLRRHNPDADYKALRVAAESLRRFGHPAPDGVRNEGPQGLQPDRFDSGTDSAAVPSDVVDADARAAESEVGEEPVDEGVEPEEADEEVVEDVPPGGAVVEVEVPVVERRPTRAEVAAWVARQPKRNRPAMSPAGRIPAATLAAYRAAHRGEVLASMVPVEGGAPMPAEAPPEEVH